MRIEWAVPSWCWENSLSTYGGGVGGHIRDSSDPYLILHTSPKSDKIMSEYRTQNNNSPGEDKGRGVYNLKGEK